MGVIPAKYTCDGDNVSPPLFISEVPDGAVSLVLIMDDPDVPSYAKHPATGESVTVWDHWVCYNLRTTVREISEGQNPPGVMGVNTRDQRAYGGPCPPDKEHRYFFKLYALDTLLDLAEGATKAEVERAMQGHIVAECKLVGRYNRPQNAA